MPSRVNWLDKRADGTTTLVLDVDAAMADRTQASCGVSDVLAPLARSGRVQLSHAFWPHPQQPPATVLRAPIVVSCARNPMNPVPWTGRGAITRGHPLQPAETRPAYGAIRAAAVVACSFEAS
jgi:hypothetical protein